MDEKAYKELLHVTVYWLAKRYGTNMNIELRNALKDRPSYVDIAWNIVGDDVIVTVLDRDPVLADPVEFGEVPLDKREEQ